MRSLLEAGSLILSVSVILSAPVSAQLGPANATGVSISTVHLTVQDPNRHRMLWADMFGGEAATRDAIEMIRLPGVVLVLTEGSPTGGSAGAYIDHVGFLVPNLASVREMVAEREIPIVSENAQNRQLTVDFPDAVRIEFTETPGLGLPLSLHHVHFFVNDGESLRAWYALTFGAEPLMRRQFFTASFPEAPSFPGPELDFLTMASERVPNTGRSIDRIGFEVRGLEAFLERLDRAGVSIDLRPEEAEGLERGLKRAVILDPLGTRIELTEGLLDR